MSEGWKETDKLRIEIVTTYRDGTETRVTVQPPDDPATADWPAKIDEYGAVWGPTNDDNETTVWA